MVMRFDKFLFRPREDLLLLREEDHLSFLADAEQQVEEGYCNCVSGRRRGYMLSSRCSSWSLSPGQISIPVRLPMR